MCQIVNRAFVKYTTLLLNLESHSLLHLLVPALLSSPINPNQKFFTINKKSYSLWMLEREVVISIYRIRSVTFVQLPFVFLQEYIDQICSSDKSGILELIHLINDLKIEPSP